MPLSSKFMLLALPFALGACVSMPNGPSVLVMPGTGMAFEQFRQDDAQCRQYAAEQTGLSAEGAADNAAVRSAALGATIGAVAGAAIGGRHGAGTGAGAGLIVGSMHGAGTAQVSGYEAQRRYDNAFVQCMYAKGHRVPVSGYYTPERQRANEPVMPSVSPQYPPPPPASR
jgi:hypothetical protein